MYTNIKRFASFKNAYFSMLFLFPVVGFAADPASSVGKSSSDGVDLNQLFSRFMSLGETTVTLLGWAGAAIGVVLVIKSLVKIVNINAGREQGSVIAWLFGFLIGLIMMAILAWSFWASGSVVGYFMGGK